jgi:hypothetical protein
VLSYRYATSPESSHTRILHDQRCCSAGLLALGRRADPSHPHSNTDVVGHNGCGRRHSSVSAGQSLCGAPRRNRTGDPILTMDRQPSAVLRRILAARATPSMPQLWAQGGQLPRPGECTRLLRRGRRGTHASTRFQGRQRGDASARGLLPAQKITSVDAVQSRSRAGSRRLPAGACTPRRPRSPRSPLRGGRHEHPHPCGSTAGAAR